MPDVLPPAYFPCIPPSLSPPLTPPPTNSQPHAHTRSDVCSTQSNIQGEEVGTGDRQEVIRVPQERTMPEAPEIHGKHGWCVTLCSADTQQGTEAQQWGELYPHVRAQLTAAIFHRGGARTRRHRYLQPREIPTVQAPR